MPGWVVVVIAIAHGERHEIGHGRCLFLRRHSGSGYCIHIATFHRVVFPKLIFF